MKPTILAAAPAALLAGTLAGCASVSVRPEDQAAWVGTPVSALDTHPIFLTMPVVRTVTADGTEIRNYVNGRNISSCSDGGTAFSGTMTSMAYGGFSSCMQNMAACNNIFYVKNGIVTAFVPIGSGGMRCYTNARLQPGFRGSTNIR
jgi:hypothetical protein